MPDLSRRKFVQLTMLGTAAAVSGCGPYHDYDDQLRGQYGGTSRLIEPFVNQPPGMRDGVPQWFATTCRMCPSGCGLNVRTIGGRAVKVEGNPLSPISRGRTCARGQASLQHLYSPERLRYPSRRGSDGKISRLNWDDAISALSTELAGRKGRIAILADAETYGRSALQLAAVSQFATAIGATAYYYSLIDDTPWRTAAGRVYGREAIPSYDIDRAAYLLAFSANFLEAWPSPVMHGRMFGDFRQGSPGASQPGRFVYIGPRMSMTAAKADLWLPCRPGSEAAVAGGILAQLGGAGLALDDAAAASGLTAQQIANVARDFKAAGANALALAGDGLVSQPAATDAITAVEALNAHAGGTLVHGGMAAGTTSSCFSQLQSLVSDIRSSRIDGVIVLGQLDPLRCAPQSSGIGDALRKASFVAVVAPIHGDIADIAHLVLPETTFLEEWTDTEPAVRQPASPVTGLCQPIVDTRFILSSGSKDAWMQPRSFADIARDVLSRQSAGTIPGPARDRLRASLPGNVAFDDLMSGPAAYAAPAPADVPLQTPALPRPSVAPAKPGTFQLILYPHVYRYDGRHAGLPWLEEIPDPMTMAVWNNWLEINAGTAHRLGIRTGDIVRVDTGAGAFELPAMPTQGIHPEALAIPLGGGRANPIAALPAHTDTATGALAYGLTPVTIARVRGARPGYDAAANTLVILEDRPGGQEPEAVKDLIHTTAKERAALAGSGA